VRLETDNQEPNSAFEETAGAASVGARIGSRSALRMVVRGETSEAGTPGPTAFGRPDLDASYERRGLILSGQLRHSRDRAAHELRWGWSLANQLSRDPVDSGSFVPQFEGKRAPFASFDFVDPDGFQNDTRRMTVGYQLEQQVGASHLLTAGADLERETGEIGSRPRDLFSPARTNLGAYLQDRVALRDRVFVTLGARLERNDNFGTRAVPRLALAWAVRRGTDGTTVRASAGEGIKEPSFFESFADSESVKGNPDLDPERSRTFDVGLEQHALSGRLRAEATLFDHEYRDQIAFKVVRFTPSFLGTYENLGRTRGRGVELSVEAAPTRHTGVSASYTYLDGEILESTSTTGLNAPGQRLLRRPRHQASLSGHAGTGRLSFGATLVLVGARADSDFLGLGLTRNEGYARLDARARARLVRGLEAFVTGENVLDREYQEALGYPALGRALRVGLRYASGSRP
jgi:vitamin B12 transporter